VGSGGGGGARLTHREVGRRVAGMTIGRAPVKAAAARNVLRLGCCAAVGGCAVARRGGHLLGGLWRACLRSIPSVSAGRS
jgi:hypothetical protein